MDWVRLGGALRKGRPVAVSGALAPSFLFAAAPQVYP